MAQITVSGRFTQHKTVAIVNKNSCLLLGKQKAEDSVSMETSRLFLKLFGTQNKGKSQDAVDLVGLAEMVSSHYSLLDCPHTSYP